MLSPYLYPVNMLPCVLRRCGELLILATLCSDVNVSIRNLLSINVQFNSCCRVCLTIVVGFVDQSRFVVIS